MPVRTYEKIVTAAKSQAVELTQEEIHAHEFNSIHIALLTNAPNKRIDACKAILLQESSDKFPILKKKDIKQRTPLDLLSALTDNAQHKLMAFCNMVGTANREHKKEAREKQKREKQEREEKERAERAEREHATRKQAKREQEKREQAKREQEQEREKKSLILQCVQTYDLTKLERTLKDVPAEDKNTLLEATDDNGNTSFLLAAKQGLLKYAQLLLDHGANSEATDNDGQTWDRLLAENTVKESLRSMVHKKASLAETMQQIPLDVDHAVNLWVEKLNIKTKGDIFNAIKMAFKDKHDKLVSEQVVDARLTKLLKHDVTNKLGRNSFLSLFCCYKFSTETRMAQTISSVQTQLKNESHARDIEISWRGKKESVERPPRPR